MRRRLLVVVDVAIGSAVLAPERLKRRHQPGHVKAIGQRPRCGRHGRLHVFLLVAREIASDDLGVHLVRRNELAPVVFLEQPQIRHETPVLAVPRDGTLPAEDDRLDDPPHARFAKPLHQAVHMRVAMADDRLLRRLDVVRRHSLVVTEVMNLLDTLAGEGVDEPRLAPGESHHLVENIRREVLTRLLGMLCIERGNLFGREIAQEQVL